MRAWYSVGLTVVMSVCLSGVPSFADEMKEDMPKGQGPCRSKVEELHATRKKLRDCLQSWVQAAKALSDDPGDDCEDHTEAFVDKAKEIKKCRLEQQKEKAKAEVKPE